MKDGYMHVQYKSAKGLRSIAFKVVQGILLVAEDCFIIISCEYYYAQLVHSTCLLLHIYKLPLVTAIVNRWEGC